MQREGLALTTPSLRMHMDRSSRRRKRIHSREFLVNRAGINRCGPVTQPTDEDIDESFTVNQQAAASVSVHDSAAGLP